MGGRGSVARALFLHLPGGGLGMSPWFLGDPRSIPHLLAFGFSGCKTGDLAFWCKPRGSKTKEEPPKASEPTWSWEEGGRRGLGAGGSQSALVPKPFGEPVPSFPSSKARESSLGKQLWGFGSGVVAEHPCHERMGSIKTGLGG